MELGFGLEERIHVLHRGKMQVAYVYAALVVGKKERAGKAKRKSRLRRGVEA